MRTFREYLKTIPHPCLEKYSQRELEIMQEGWSAALESVLSNCPTVEINSSDKNLSEKGDIV